MQMMPKMSCPQRVASDEAARTSAAPDVVVISTPGEGSFIAHGYRPRVYATYTCLRDPVDQVHGLVNAPWPRSTLVIAAAQRNQGQAVLGETRGRRNLDRFSRKMFQRD